MFKKIGLNYTPVSSIAAGLEMVILPDGSYEMNIVVLKKEKSKLSSVMQQEGITNFEEVAKILDPKWPIFILINGKGVIHKKVNIGESDTSITLLNKVLPNTNLNDFVIQKTPVSDSEVFVSVIRASVLNEIIAQLEKFNIRSVAGCLLGPFIIADVLPLISVNAIKNGQLNIGNFQLKIKDQQITDLVSTDVNDDQHVLIGKSSVPQKLVIAFAGSLSYFTGNTYGIQDSEAINYIKEEFTQKQKFEFRGWVLMVATFLILMINYFIFNHYWSKANEMNSKLALVESALTHYETLKVEFAQKNDFLEQNGLLENSRTSFYIDKLAEGLPASIQWTDVAIHPLKKKEAKDESDVLFFENKTILISGNCQNSNELNNWMKDLKNIGWVNDVSMLNYKQDSDNEKGVFSIEVKVK